MLTSFPLFAQTENKPATKQVASGMTQDTNHDLNIRAYMELLRTDIRSAKAEIVGKVMQLDTDESVKFWPIYKMYETDLSKIGDQIVSLVKTYVENYDSMTSEIADQLATKLLDIQRQRVELKSTYYGKFKEALDSITAARFLQVENQLENLLDLQMSSELPVMSK